MHLLWFLCLQRLEQNLCLVQRSEQYGFCQFWVCAVLWFLGSVCHWRFQLIVDFALDSFSVGGWTEGILWVFDVGPKVLEEADLCHLLEAENVFYLLCHFKYIISLIWLVNYTFIHFNFSTPFYPFSFFFSIIFCHLLIIGHLRVKIKEWNW